ncbi:helix-turn-helix domain-containing protein [Bernardetia sp. OM2101]|uniref:helix-turn-helix domain-containing protein n=1 Tax=Bernardetia sp. OM2101 TaxID=3344876 RepID=UPI0035D0E609
MRGKEIHAAIKSERSRKGYSQLDMSERLDVTQNAYSKIERGISAMSLDRFLRICEILNFNPSKFLEYCKYSMEKESYDEYEQRQKLQDDNRRNIINSDSDLEWKLFTLKERLIEKEKLVKEKESLISILIEKVNSLEKQIKENSKNK